MKRDFVSEGAAAQRGERQKGERRRERRREREKAPPRGSIHHTSGGVIRTWEEGFEVRTSKRLYKHTRILPKIRGIETDEITALS